jgi:hypothetical protein
LYILNNNNNNCPTAATTAATAKAVGSTLEAIIAFVVIIRKVAVFVEVVSIYPQYHVGAIRVSVSSHAYLIGASIEPE